MSDTYNYEVLEPGGHARLVGNVLDRISGASANHASAVGSSRAMLGDAETASWTERTTAADGAALIEAVYGNTLRWNQLVDLSNNTSTVFNTVTRTRSSDGSVTFTGTAEGTGSPQYATLTDKLLKITSGHKYFLTKSNDNLAFYVNVSGSNNNPVAGSSIFTALQSSDSASIYITVPATGYDFGTYECYPQLFDLTQMFGAGNEPATVAEFEALFPLPYYPYDAGSLLPVRMEGVETVGFNLWDEEWESGYVDSSTGANVSNASRIRSRNYIPTFPSTTYCNSSSYTLCVIAFDADKNCLGEIGNINGGTTFTTSANCRYVRFWRTATTYNNDICINISDSARNGTYEPHWSSTLAIPATDLRRLPDGTCDELTNNALVRRVGSINIAASDWHATGASMTYGDQYETTLTTPAVSGTQGYDNSRCDVYDNTSITTANQPVNTIRRSNNGLKAFVVVATGTTPSACEFIYPLATPTTTPIDPPLPLSYRVGAGGTERVMVASGTTSAPPVFATRYPLDPTNLAASIAPRESATAEANHAVGDLIMLGWTLCKVTTAIARGEAITIGTNVTKTSVAAELAALSE